MRTSDHADSDIRVLKSQLQTQTELAESYKKQLQTVSGEVFLFLQQQQQQQKKNEILNPVCSDRYGKAPETGNIGRVPSRVET